MKLKLMKPVCPDSPFIDADWITFQYKCKRNTSPTVSFQLSPKNSYGFLFQTAQNFHDVANQIFRRKYNQYDKWKTLEETGLKAPEKLKVNIAYETPIAFWRGLPRRLIDKIAEFDFFGRFYRVGWPKEGRLHKRDNFKKANPKELVISVLDNVLQDQRGNEFKRLKEMLAGTGFIRYQFSEGGGSAHIYRPEEHKFLINPEEIDYYKIQELEEIARTEPENLQAQYKHRDSKATVLVQGEVDREIIGEVPKDFENYLKYGHYSIKGGNITVNYNGYVNTNKVSVSLEKTNLEQAERFAQLGVGRTAIIIEPKQNNGPSKSSVCFFNDGKPCRKQAYF